MHEAGITQRILEVALERAHSAGASCVTAVHLEIGEDSDVEPEAVRHYWPEISRSTPAEGASLSFVAAEDPMACRVVAIDVP